MFIYFFFSAVNYQTLFVCFKGSMAVVCLIAWSMCRYLQRSPEVRPNHNNPSIGHLLEGQTFNPVLHWTDTGFYFNNPTPGPLKCMYCLNVFCCCIFLYFAQPFRSRFDKRTLQYILRHNSHMTAICGGVNTVVWHSTVLSIFGYFCPKNF